MTTEVSVLLDASMAATDAGRRMQVVQSRCDAALEERAVWADEHLRVALAADDGLLEHGTYELSAPLWALELGASMGVTPEIEDENVVSNWSWLAYTREWNQGRSGSADVDAEAVVSAVERAIDSPSVGQAAQVAAAGPVTLRARFDWTALTTATRELVTVRSEPAPGAWEAARSATMRLGASSPLWREVLGGSTPGPGRGFGR